MKISTRGRYALEAVLDIAMHEKNGPVNLKALSERCQISEAYILQIFSHLRKSGILRSLRGAQGGYLLAKRTDEITVADILISVEGPLTPVNCIVDEDELCDRFEYCTTRSLWTDIMTTLTDIANGITIASLIEYFEKMDSSSADMDFMI